MRFIIKNKNFFYRKIEITWERLFFLSQNAIYVLVNSIVIYIFILKYSLLLTYVLYALCIVVAAEYRSWLEQITNAAFRHLCVPHVPISQRWALWIFNGVASLSFFRWLYELSHLILMLHFVCVWYRSYATICFSIRYRQSLNVQSHYSLLLKVCSYMNGCIPRVFFECYV